MTVPLSIEWSLSRPFYCGKMSKYIPRDSFQRSHLWQLTTNSPRCYTGSPSFFPEKIGKKRGKTSYEYYSPNMHTSSLTEL